MLMTLVPIIGVGAYALTSMLNGIAIEKELVEIKEAIREVHDLGDMVHYLEVRFRRVKCANRSHPSVVHIIGNVICVII